MSRPDISTIPVMVAGWIQSTFTLGKKLIEDYPETADVTVELREELNSFSRNLPLIRCFTSEAVIDEDWELIQKEVGINPFDREDVTVQSI